MPKVMPVAIRDQTGDFIRQMAQGNQALAQLYTQLLARYEERQAAQEFQREQMQYREGMADRRTADADQRWYDRTNYAHNLRNPQGAPQGPNYLGPGAAGTPNPMGPQQPPPTGPAAPTSAGPAARPSVYTIDNNPFRQGAGTSAPATPAPQSSIPGAMDAYAQAPRGAEHTDFSSQSRKPLPTVEQPPGPPKREPPTNTQLPAQPRVTAKTAATRPQGQFLDIDQRWIDLMHQMEDKYNLPRGVMMTAYGIENGGGRQFGRNKSGSAEGIYQFTKELRDEHKLTDQDIYNPAKMIPAAAYNMRRNADILEQNYKVKLPLTPEAIPMFMGLHQWGSGAGPRIVAAYLQNPDARMSESNVMGTHKDKNGNVLSNYTILAQNGHKPTVTVRDALQNKAVPWYSAYTQQFSEHAHQPQGKYVSTPVPPPQQPQGGDPNAPRPPGGILPQQHGTMGTNPRLVRAVRGGAELALPEGYTLEQTSGARPGGRSASHHHRGNAGDFRIITPDGTRIPHSGPDTTGLYTRLARGVKTWIAENDPKLMPLVGYGGAFETSRGSGRPDLMHWDLGGSRGRLRPEVQFARLQPLGDNERNAPIQVAQQQPQKPVKVAGQTPIPDTTVPPTPPERAIMPAISRIPTSPEVAATFDNKIATAGFDRRTPDVAASIIEGPPPIKAGASTLAARSDLEYGMPKELQAANVPMPKPRPAEAPVPVEPTIAAAEPQKPITWDAEVTPSRAVPSMDAEVTQAAPSTGPVQLDNDLFAGTSQVHVPPQLDAGITSKQPLPADFTPPARQGTGEQQLGGAAPPEYKKLTPELDVPTAEARTPLPPGFKVPFPTLGGDDATAAASAPSGQMPRDMGLPLPDRLPPPLPENIPQSTSAPTIQRILEAIYKGDIPSMATTTEPSPKDLQPIPLRHVQDAVYGGDGARPKGPSRAQQELEYARNATPRLTADIIKQRLDPTKNDPEGDAKQAAFKAAVEQWIAEKYQGAVDWWNTPSTPKQHQSQHPQSAPAPAPAPIRTMPDGRPYIPQAEPLKVPPRPGSTPGNTTLSTGPQQGAAPLPGLPGQKNPLTGRVDIPKPQVQPDGTILYTEPGEIVNEAVE